ncbi:AMP-binding enzyme [Hirsutella rhossiliensis]
MLFILPFLYALFVQRQATDIIPFEQFGLGRIRRLNKDTEMRPRGLRERAINLSFNQQVLDPTQARRLLDQLDYMLNQLCTHAGSDDVALMHLSMVCQQDLHAIWTASSVGNQRMPHRRVAYCHGYQRLGRRAFLSRFSYSISNCYSAIDHIQQRLGIKTTTPYLYIPSEHNRFNDIEGAVRRLRVNYLDTTPSLTRTINPSAVPSVETIAVRVHPIELLNLGLICGLNGWIISNVPPDALGPVGGIGELVLEGPLGGRGYANSPDETAKSFVRDPEPGRRGQTYRTGDLTTRFLKTLPAYIIDRKALRLLGSQAKEKERAALLGLAVETISQQDNFFDIGGDLVAAIELVRDARKFGLCLSVVMVFRHLKLIDMAQETASLSSRPLIAHCTPLPTPAELSAMISADEKAITDVLPRFGSQRIRRSCFEYATG